jgi:hypothetical protein
MFIFGVIQGNAGGVQRKTLFEKNRVMKMGIRDNASGPYTVKKRFPVPSQDVINQTLPAEEYFNYSQPGRVWLVPSQLGTGNLLTFFYSIGVVPSSVPDP